MAKRSIRLLSCLACVCIGVASATAFEITVVNEEGELVERIQSDEPDKADQPGAWRRFPRPKTIYDGRFRYHERVLERNGGSAETEAAVLRALRWLEANRNADGSWGEQPFKTAMTGLALLCFLGRGEGNRSDEFGGAVREGLVWLLDRQDEGGYFTPERRRAWQHAIATCAIAEAWAMTKNDKLAVVLAKAVRPICESQTGEGGWYDGSQRTGGNTALSGWQVQALHLTFRAGIRFSDKMLLEAIRLVPGDVRSRFSPETGFGWLGTLPSGSKETNYATTAIGTFCLQSLGDGGSREAQAALDIMRTYTCDWAGTDGGALGPLCGWYYVTQAMFHARMNQGRSPYWKHWNPPLSAMLLEQQKPDGRWHFPESDGGRRERAQFAGRSRHVYSTAMCCLMLETYYRYAPQFRAWPVDSETGEPFEVAAEDWDHSEAPDAPLPDVSAFETFPGEFDLVEPGQDDDAESEGITPLPEDVQAEGRVDEAPAAGRAAPTNDPNAPLTRFTVTFTGEKVAIDRTDIHPDLDRLEVAPRAFVGRVARLTELGDEVYVLVHLTFDAEQDEIDALLDGLERAGARVTVVPAEPAPE